MQAIRKTWLTCGLLNAPVKIYSAADDEKEIHFKLGGHDGEPVEQLYVLKEDERLMYAGKKEELQGRRLVKAFDRDRMTKLFNDDVVNKTALDEAEADALVGEDGSDLQEINIDQFVNLKDVPWERGKALYYLGPDKQVGGKSFETFKVALKKRKVAGIAKVVVKKRQMLLAIYEQDGAILALRLRFANEMRSVGDDSVGDDLVDDRVKVKQDEVKLMTTLIGEYMADPSEIDAERDTYVDAKVEMVEAILQGKEIGTKKPKKTAQTKDDGLKAALEESVKQTKARKSKGKVKA